MTGWVTTSTFEAKLTASDGAAGDIFGRSVAISGDTLVVGAILDDIGANNEQGSAYIFVRPGTSWADMTETAKLTASDGAAGDVFSRSVAISGDTVVVGAWGDDIGANDQQGSAYVFGFVSDVDVVEIDIKPGADPNCINPKSKGKTPVALLGNGVDVVEVILSTIEIDDDDDPGTEGVMPVKTAYEDVNGDGKNDLIMHFDTPALKAAGILVDGNELFVTGELIGVIPIVASDTIFLAGGPTCP